MLNPMRVGPAAHRAHGRAGSDTAVNWLHAVWARPCQLRNDGRTSMYIRYDNHNCPHCGQVYATSLSERPTRLGTGQRQCKRCKRFFNDGSAEWENLTQGFQQHPFLSNWLCQTHVSAGESILSVGVGPQQHQCLGRSQSRTTDAQRCAGGQVFRNTPDVSGSPTDCSVIA